MTALLLLVLLLAVPAGAAQLILDEPMYAGEKFIIEYTCSKNGKPVKCTALEPPCLAKMEAALRAVGPLAFGPPQTPQQFMEALKLFNESQKDCWSKP
jgi:hypothetical protein